MSDLKVDANKIIGLLLVAVLGMAGWYLQQVASRLETLDATLDEVTRSVDALELYIRFESQADELEREVREDDEDGDTETPGHGSTPGGTDPD